MNLKSIKERRVEAGLTQDQLIQKSGLRISREFLSMVEAGKRFLTKDSTILLSAALKCEPLELFLGQTLSNLDIDLSKRDQAVKSALDYVKMGAALKEAEREARGKLDYGDRDSFGRKAVKEKETTRDSYGIKRIAVKEKEAKTYRDGYGIKRTAEKDNPEISSKSNDKTVGEMDPDEILKKLKASKKRHAERKDE